MRRHLTILHIALVAAGLSVLGSASVLAATINVTANVTTSQTWTSDNTYVLTRPIYVTNGATLTIQAGTTVRGETESAPGAHDPGTLIITRGSKLMAIGSAEKPIVFTDLADNNIGGNPGTAPYNTVANALGLTGRWGGVILLGRGYVANNTAGAPNPAREFQIEGLDMTGGLGFYGNGGNDDDDSGTVQYISIRYGGFNLAANNEINGLTLGGVGRQTDIQYIDIYQNKDDMVEFFGGSANVKYISGVAGGDDSVDYDEGWRGWIQFAFMVQGTPGSDKSDKAGEHDGGNGPDTSLPLAIPTIYNATYVGLGQKAYTNKAQNTVLHFRDNAGGRYYNSFFADFGGAPICIEGGVFPAGPNAAGTSGERAVTAYTIDAFQIGPPSTTQLELEQNTWWCMGNGGIVPSGDATASGCSNQNHYAPASFFGLATGNSYLTCASPLPIKALTRTPIGGTVPDPITSIDPRPAPGMLETIETVKTPPANGFFQNVTHRGAFNPNRNWLWGWSTPARLGLFPCNISEVFGLVFPTKTSLSWNPVPGAGIVYDVLRSIDPSDFTIAICIESNDGTNTTASDAGIPALGTAYFYLVRAEAACGVGSLGPMSNGFERVGGNCP